jgi:hypothetical protein
MLRVPRSLPALVVLASALPSGAAMHWPCEAFYAAQLSRARAAMQRGEVGEALEHLRTADSILTECRRGPAPGARPDGTDEERELARAGGLAAGSSS